MNVSKDKKIYFLSGASGVGKSTLIKNLQQDASLKGWKFFHFDSIGVPSLEEMEKEYGSGSKWQEAMTHKWVDRLIQEEDEENLVLEGQVNLQFIQDAFEKHQFTNYQAFLVDCSFEEMAYRLTHKRKQPELLTEDMKNWLSYLRNQAKDFGIPILLTSERSEEESLLAFKKIIETT